jgi:hypothetical protein
LVLTTTAVLLLALFAALLSLAVLPQEIVNASVATLNVDSKILIVFIF